LAPRSRSGPRPGRALAALAVLILIMLISITGKDTFSPGNWHNRFKVGLGLDLSSGTQVVLQAHDAKGAPSSSEMQEAIGVLLSRVNGTGNTGAQVQQIGSDLLEVTVPGKPPQSTIALVSTTAKLAFRPVLLAAPYVAPTATSTPSPSASPSASAKASGTASPTTSATSTATSTATPTASSSPKASTSDVSARLASTPSPTVSATPTATPTATGTATPSATPTPTPTPTSSSTAASTSTAPVTYGDQSAVNKETMALFNKLVCKPGPNATTVNSSWKATVGYTDALDQWDNPKNQIVSCDPSGTKYVLGPTTFEGNAITAVSPEVGQNSTQWVVSITLNDAASAAWSTVTTNQYDKYYPNIDSDEDDAYLDMNAIVLDGNVQEAPQTQAALTSGSFQIEGPTGVGFTQAEATQLASLIQYGALPLNFSVQSVQSVSAQLGHESLDAGMIAAIIGLVLVVFYLFYYYRGLGLVSVSSLLIAALLAYLAVVILSQYQNFTMSLSAIAGLVVAIGITADSFIVYFERLRDEVRDGKTLRPAVEAGWKRARRTILVSDTVSFVAAVILYHFAVSDVQGFAYTLGLTTIIDVVVVFLFTKPMVTLLSGTEFFGGGHKWSGLDPERLGARAPWRGGPRRTVRAQRTTVRRQTGSSASPSTSKEA
jgi:preprotein translocase subunit SecD